MKKSHSVPLTRESYEALQEELKALDPRRAAEGDTGNCRGPRSRRPFRKCRVRCRQEQPELPRRAHPGTAAQLARAYVVDLSKLKPDKVVFGATVTVYDTATEEESTFKIVGEDEADIKQGKISYTSPVGKALIGHKLDDSVKAKVPSG